MRKFRATTMCLSAALLLVAACGGEGSGGSAATTTQDLKLRLNWVPYAADHAFYYLGVERGIYQDNGIDLTIEPGNGSATVFKLVDNGSEPVALVDAATMLKGVAAGMDVTMVASITQTSPMAFVFRKDAPIEGPDDFKGSKIAVTQGDSLSQVLPAVIAAIGLDPGDVTTVSAPTPAAKETAVLRGEADALLGYFTEQPLRMQATTGVPMGWKSFSDFGVNTFNMGLVMNKSWLADNGDLAQRFVTATQQAIEAAVEDPRAAADAFVAKNPKFDKNLALKEIEATIPLLPTDASKGKPVGWMADSDWQTTVDVMTKYGGVQSVPIADLFTNKLVEAGS